MPHIYIPEVILSKEDYEMIQDNQVPIDAYVASRIREESMFVYIQDLDATYKRVKNNSWNSELDSRKLSENPDNHFPISDT
tara:strand:- start:155 stop:397 length:243 start_codon:yes stop_codon:yes gene_type:complete